MFTKSLASEQKKLLHDTVKLHKEHNQICV